MNFGRNFSAGDHIFDFGSGCGYQGAWLKAYYGMETFGIDMTSSAVDWANVPGTYCIGDASNVSYVKDNVFDGAYSYAVLYHLPYALQCQSVLEAIRIVKPGGFIYLGWFGCHIAGNPSPDPDGDFWPKCIKDSGVKVKSLEVVKETAIIGSWGLGIMDNEACGVPNYGIQVTV